MLKYCGGLSSGLVIATLLDSSLAPKPDCWISRTWVLLNISHPSFCCCCCLCDQFLYFWTLDYKFWCLTEVLIFWNRGLGCIWVLGRNLEPRMGENWILSLTILWIIFCFAWRSFVLLARSSSARCGSRGIPHSSDYDYLCNLGQLSLPYLNSTSLANNSNLEAVNIGEAWEVLSLIPIYMCAPLTHLYFGGGEVGLLPSRTIWFVTTPNKNTKSELTF